MSPPIEKIRGDVKALTGKVQMAATSLIKKLERPDTPAVYFGVKKDVEEVARLSQAVLGKLSRDIER